MELHLCTLQESNSSSCDTCGEDNDDDEPLQPTFENLTNLPKTKDKLHVNFDHLSIVSEETFSGSCENPSSPNLVENITDPIKLESDEYKPDACSALIDFQSIVPPLAYFENLCYEDIGPNLGMVWEEKTVLYVLNSKLENITCRRFR